MSTTRYADRWSNALRDSHEMTARAELWYGSPLAMVGSLNLVGGSVSCDRQASVRRTARITVDPSAINDPVLGPKLNPFGSLLKLYRGIRYPGGATEEQQIFTGRIDSVDESLDGLEISASDMASMVVDSKFYVISPGEMTIPPGTTVTAECTTLIQNALPGATVTVDTGVDTVTQAPRGMSFGTERADVLDSLCTQIGAEWFADSTGTFHIANLPAAITANTKPVWIVDSGDSGVLVKRNTSTDRSGVYNGVSVTGEAIGGTTPATGHYEITSTDDPILYWGGPFGKIPGFYTGQVIRRSIDGNPLAQKLAANTIARVSSVNVSCMANAKLSLGDVIRVFDGRVGLNQMMYVQTMEIPLAPGDAMSMTLYKAVLINSAGALQGLPLSIPVGASWKPTWPSWEPTWPSE